MKKMAFLMSKAFQLYDQQMVVSSIPQYDGSLSDYMNRPV